MTLTEELCRLLGELGLGTYSETTGGTIYHLALPQSPDEAMAVAPYPGSESDAKLPYDEPRIQVRVRGTQADATTANDTAQAVYDALHGLRSRTLPGGTWLVHCIGINAGPVYIARDGNGRHEFVVNFRVEVERVTANRT